MFETVICVSMLVVCIVSVSVDIKRLKAVRENTKVYKGLEKQTLNFRNEVRIYVDEQNKSSISFDELVERLETTMKKRIGDPISRKSLTL